MRPPTSSSTASRCTPESPANRPTITDTSADVVNLASGNTITGLDIDPQGGGGIAGGTR